MHKFFSLHFNIWQGLECTEICEVLTPFTFNCLKLAIKTLEKGVKYVQS